MIAQTTVLDEYADLADRKAELKAELTKVEAQLGKLEPQALDWFQQAGVKSVKLDSGRAMFIRRELWAGRADGVDNEQAIAGLVAAGLSEFAAPRINTQKLSAYCRELDAEGQPLPGAFENIIVVNEKFRIGSRKG